MRRCKSIAQTINHIRGVCRLEMTFEESSSQTDVAHYIVAHNEVLANLDSHAEERRDLASGVPPGDHKEDTCAIEMQASSFQAFDGRCRWFPPVPRQLRCTRHAVFMHSRAHQGIQVSNKLTRLKPHHQMMMFSMPTCANLFVAYTG